MKNRPNREVGFVLSLLTILAISAAAVAQTKQAAPANHPDFSGVWSPTVDPGAAKTHQGGTFSRELAPMTPLAEDQFTYNRNPYDPLANGRAELNPGVQCMPVGPSALWSYTRTSGSYFEVIQSDRRVLLFFEYDHWIRTIWTDGRDHPADQDLTWMGHSIGHWEGDTLVIDTIKIHAETWLDEAGHPHSDQLHLTERIRRPDHDTLTINLTFDDPKMYTKPWGGQVVAKLKPQGELEEKVVCEERWLNHTHSY